MSVVRSVPITLRYKISFNLTLTMYEYSVPGDSPVTSNVTDVPGM